MHNHGDEHGGDDRDLEEAVLVERRAELVGDRQRHQQQPTGHHADAVEDVGGAAADRGAQPPRRPHEGQCRTDEHPGRPRVGALVDPGDVGAVAEQHRHEHTRRDGAHHRGDEGPAPTEPTHAEREEHRPDQVELLLDGERPQVLHERGSAHALEVRLLRDDEEPVGDVAQRCGHIAPQRRHLVRQEHHADGDDGGEGEEERREQPSGAADVEVLEVDPVLVAPAGEQDRRDQEAADDEEDLDAQEAALQDLAAPEPRELGVVDEHGHDGDRPHAVEPGRVRHPDLPADPVARRRRRCRRPRPRCRSPRRARDTTVARRRRALEDVGHAGSGRGRGSGSGPGTIVPHPP
jgi:hypothetical protein